MKYEEIRQLILTVDEQVLTNQMINSLLKFLPSSDEVVLVIRVGLNVATMFVLFFLFSSSS